MRFERASDRGNFGNLESSIEFELMTTVVQNEGWPTDSRSIRILRDLGKFYERFASCNR